MQSMAHLLLVERPSGQWRRLTAPESTDTNSAWLVRAINYLTGQGNTALDSQTALRNI